MATNKQQTKYKKDLAKYKKKRRLILAMTIITAIVSVLWTAAIVGVGLYITYLKLPSVGLKPIFYVLSWLAICVLAAFVLIIGIQISASVVQIYKSPYEQFYTSLIVCGVLFTGLVPGILYGITSHTYCGSTKPVDPQETARKQKQAKEKQERIEKERRREANDPRNYFTEDEDDVGEIPDINRVDFKDLKNVFEDE